MRSICYDSVACACDMGCWSVGRLGRTSQALRVLSAKSCGSSHVTDTSTPDYLVSSTTVTGQGPREMFASYPSVGLGAGRGTCILCIVDNFLRGLQIDEVESSSATSAPSHAYPS